MKQSAQGTTRRRVRKACEPCRHRKVKCDGSDPCAICSGYGYNCVYANRSATTDAEPSTPQQLPERKDFQPPLDSHHDPGHLVNKIAYTELQREENPKKRFFVLSEDDRSFRNLNTSFTRVDSALALPRSLGISLHMDELPRLQPFGFNLGTRLEPVPPPRSKLFNLVTVRDVEIFSNVYFATIHPVFGFLDISGFEKQAFRCLMSQDTDVGFEVVLCGVLALGSFYSPVEQLLHEAEIVEHARLALDHTFAHSETRLSVDQVAGWILRALYLRNTAKPHLSWVASNMAMHVAEAIGLHQEMSEMKALNPRLVTPAEIETRRGTFWVAASLNRSFAVHYGRTPIKLQHVGCLYPKPTSGADTISDFLGLIRLLPPQSQNVPTMADLPELTESLERLSKVRVEGLPLLLLRAEICFCVCRKIRYLGIILAAAHFEMLIIVIRSALDAAKTLGERREPWWSITGVPFQAICVLLSINTVKSLSLIPDAMETLQNLTYIFNTHSSREALQTAQNLVKASEANKRKELECLQRCLNLTTNISGSAGSQSDVSEQLVDFQSFAWPNNMDLGWSAFLDLPSYANNLVPTS